MRGRREKIACQSRDCAAKTLRKCFVQQRLRKTVAQSQDVLNTISRLRVQMTVVAHCCLQQHGSYEKPTKILITLSCNYVHIIIRLVFGSWTHGMEGVGKDQLVDLCPSGEDVPRTQRSDLGIRRPGQRRQA